MMYTVLGLHMVSKMQVSWHTFACCLKNDGCQQRERKRETGQCDLQSGLC